MNDQQFPGQPEDEAQTGRVDDPLIFPCSGASDTGAIADGAARRLDRSGVARMYCLAGVGAKVERIVNSTEAAQRLVALDGCENDCARRMLEAAGFRPVLHLRITDLGMTKGSSPASEERIREVSDELRRRLDEIE